MLKRVALLGAVFAVLGAAQAVAQPRATIRWTSHGIPHILANDWEGLGYGYGFALASQNICTMADTYVTVDAQRSRYFGPGGSYSFRGNSTNPNNLNSDFFYQRIIDRGTVESLLKLKPPLGPKPQIDEAVRGYAKGYNDFLRRRGVNDPNCQGEPWVHPIRPIEVYRRFYQLGLLASQGVAIDGIGGAQPLLGGASSSGASAASAPDRSMVEKLGERLPLGGIGSNAVALGSEATKNGNGMLLGNPHFPWDGSERFFQSQLTIPGQVDVAGASLLGVPVVLIGHNANLAWSHTVSTAFRFTPFELNLVPGSPTTYMYNGKQRKMTADRVTVTVQNANGSLGTRRRTLYSTVQGPILTSILGLPIFPWTPTTAYAMGDANADNFRYLNHFFDTDRAQSTRQLYEILKRDQGIPWVNTIAADSRGNAFYADISVVPHVTNAQVARCGNGALGQITWQLLRLPVLNGSTSSCGWGSDRDAVEPGIFGPSHLPHLFRRDYVTNSNDSFWLSNPKHPLTGFARIIGDERTARSLRTRLGLIMVRQRLAGTDGRAGKGFSLRDLQSMVFNNRQYAGELFRGQLVQLCNSLPVAISSSGPISVSAACPVLAAWDLHDNLDSKGAILFRRFASHLLASVGGLVAPPGIYQVPFSASNPVDTPRGLNTLNPLVQQALGDAVHDLQASGIPLDAPLRGWQYERRSGERIPIHGGPGTLGVFNAINVGWVPKLGYPNVPHGSSFVMTVRFDGRDGCPKGATILTYSQSTNPASPYFADQTRLFSRKKWVSMPYCEREILSNGKLRIVKLNGGA